MKLTQQKVDHFRVNNSMAFIPFTVLTSVQFQNIPQNGHPLPSKQFLPIPPHFHLYFLSLWIFPLNGITRYMTFCVCLLSLQSLSHVRLFVTPWTAAGQASLSITNSRSLLKLMSIESLMPSSRLIFCRPLLLSLTVMFLGPIHVVACIYLL